jgi:ribosomal protein S18 acetylase RimI-like enzyme
MNIRFGEEDDYLQLAELKWLHMEEDDTDYNETNVVGVDKEEFISEYVSFLERDSNYQIFVAEENGTVLSAMFLCMIPKLPKPNRNSESIAYLTSVYTRKEYRNKEIGTSLLTFIKEYAIKQKCELLFVWPSDKSVSWYERNGFTNENEIYECGLLGE